MLLKSVQAGCTTIVSRKCADQRPRVHDRPSSTVSEGRRRWGCRQSKDVTCST